MSEQGDLEIIALLPYFKEKYTEPIEGEGAAQSHLPHGSALFAHVPPSTEWRKGIVYPIHA